VAGRFVSALTTPQWKHSNVVRQFARITSERAVGQVGYPGAVLLSFCVALLAYNVISVVKIAIAAVHGAEAKREDISGYYLAGELAAAYHGMIIAIPPAEWARRFASLKLPQNSGEPHNAWSHCGPTHEAYAEFCTSFSGKGPVVGAGVGV